MFLTLKDSKGRVQTCEEWVKDMCSSDREALYKALAPYVEANSTEPASLEKFRKDFCNLSNGDRKVFIKMIQDEFDAALQADLDRRRKEAYGAGWEKSVADAKARAEQARREVHNDN